MSVVLPTLVIEGETLHAVRTELQLKPAGTAVPAPEIISLDVIGPLAVAPRLGREGRPSEMVMSTPVPDSCEAAEPAGPVMASKPVRTPVAFG